MISVVTITYNNFDELQETIQSLDGSSFEELVVINGGSCSKTKSYLEKLSLEGIKTKIVSESDNGIADAFNKGVVRASEELIIFLNSGDLIGNKNYFSDVKRIFFRKPFV